MKRLIIFVLLIFAAGLLVSCSVFDAWGAQESEKARSLALDNQSKESAINERATAAAGQAYATATGVALQAQATQTAVAISANATAAANAFQATATARAQEYLVRATATAEPFNASIAATNATNDQARTWGGTSILCVFTFALLAFAIAGSGWLSARGKEIRRDASGQLPAVLIGGEIIDPARQLATVATPPPGPVWRIYRAVHLLKTGEWLSEPGRPTELPSVAQRLALAENANQTTAIASLSSHPQSRTELKDKIEIIGGLIAPRNDVPSSRVIVQGDSALRLIAEGLRQKLLDEGRDVSMLPAPESETLEAR